jgi:hypothetical protein
VEHQLQVAVSTRTRGRPPVVAISESGQVRSSFQIAMMESPYHWGSCRSVGTTL